MSRLWIGVLSLLLSASAFGQVNGLPAQSVLGVNDGVHAGQDFLFCNTTNPSTSTNAQGWVGSTGSGTCTSYGLNIPSAVPTGPALMEFPSPTSSFSQGAWVNPTSLTTTAQCLAATPPVLTPCIAYQTGPLTGLTSTYTGSTVTLYTTNAPAGALFEFKISIVENANATGTVGGGPALTFSAWTPTVIPSGNLNGYSLFNFTFQTQTYTIFDSTVFSIDTKSGTSLAFNMATVSGTGTLTWGYQLVVERIY